MTDTLQALAAIAVIIAMWLFLRPRKQPGEWRGKVRCTWILCRHIHYPSERWPMTDSKGRLVRVCPRCKHPDSVRVDSKGVKIT